MPALTTALTITARDPGSRARAGVLRTAHGEVRTPHFVPLATKATVKGLLPAEVAALGFDIVLGNTYHLFLDPGHELIAGLGGLHEFMGWRGPIVTDSGGFQVFSMGYGTVADEIKGRAPSGADRAGKVLEIAEAGVRFRSYLDGSEKLHRARDVDGDPGRAGLGPRARVRRVHAVPRRPRLHRPLDRAHPPLAAPLPGLAPRPRAGGPARLRHRPGRRLRGPARRVGPGDRGERGRRHRDRRLARGRQGRDVQGGRLDDGPLPEDRPRHLLGIGEIDDLIRGVELGIDTFDCAMPTRLGRHGMALVPDPEHRWRVDLTGARFKHSDAPLMEGCPCPACALGLSRGYFRYLAKARELTGMRLLTLHNLAFVARLMARLRAGDRRRHAGRRGGGRCGRRRCRDLARDVLDELLHLVRPPLRRPGRRRPRAAGRASDEFEVARPRRSLRRRRGREHEQRRERPAQAALSALLAGRPRPRGRRGAARPSPARCAAAAPVGARAAGGRAARRRPGDVRAVGRGPSAGVASVGEATARVIWSGPTPRTPSVSASRKESASG